jgi:hypothetical protein
MLDNVWTSNETISLFTDSAGGRDKGSAFIFRVDGLKVVGQKNGRTMGSLLILRFRIISSCHFGAQLGNTFKK